MTIVPDPDYDFVPPLPDQPVGKKGTQCGECGIKFEYNSMYAFWCPSPKCPVYPKGL